MSKIITKIPFQVEINRIIEVLAKQIYQNPFALLRENCQNAFDAILMRKAKESFQPTITVEISARKVSIADNGVGMTEIELKENFWRAGSSSKNTPEAKAAGVVGTFGIGAMANFGVASKLTVVTRSLREDRTIQSSVEKNNLSATNDCIELFETDKRPDFGTTIVADLSEDINIQDATKYIAEIVKFLKIDVYVNNVKISGADIIQVTKGDFQKGHEFEIKGCSFSQLNLLFDAKASIAPSGQIFVEASNFEQEGKKINGTLSLKSDTHSISAYRSSFYLSPAPVSSTYRFGGIIDLPFIEPTAGREALVTSSIQIIQQLIQFVETSISTEIAKSEFCDNSINFINWVLGHRRFDLVGNLTLRLLPNDKRIKISDVLSKTQSSKISYYEGSNNEIINMFSSEDSPLVVTSSQNPRRNLEILYLSQSKAFEKISDEPRINKRNENTLSYEEAAIAFKLASILKDDYFLDCKIQFADISHGIPILVENKNGTINIFLDSNKSTVSILIKVYRDEFHLISGFIKDFIRVNIFPKVSSWVPSSTRQGADAFLKAINKPKEYFTIDYSETTHLSEVWDLYKEGKINLEDAISRTSNITSKSIQTFEKSTQMDAREVINDVIVSQAKINESLSSNPEQNGFGPLPAITRLEVESGAKMLVLKDGDQDLNGYKCFIALSESASRYFGEFFFQPHRTEIIWAGQKLLYIFLHHSNEFGAYYELTSSELISPISKGQSFYTSTIILKNKVYIPVPEEIKRAVVPEENSCKRFEIRYEILYPENR